MRHEKERGIMDGMGDVLFLSLDRFSCCSSIAMACVKRFIVFLPRGGLKRSGGPGF